MHHLFKKLLPVLSVILLSACGGGGKMEAKEPVSGFEKTFNFR